LNILKCHSIIREINNLIIYIHRNCEITDVYFIKFLLKYTFNFKFMKMDLREVGKWEGSGLDLSGSG
jgi:hypothetical protein